MYNVCSRYRDRCGPDYLWYDLILSAYSRWGKISYVSTFYTEFLKMSNSPHIFLLIADEYYSVIRGYANKYGFNFCRFFVFSIFRLTPKCSNNIHLSTTQLKWLGSSMVVCLTMAVNAAVFGTGIWRQNCVIWSCIMDKSYVIIFRYIPICSYISDVVVVQPNCCAVWIFKKEEFLHIIPVFLAKFNYWSLC